MKYSESLLYTRYKVEMPWKTEHEKNIVWHLFMTQEGMWGIRKYKPNQSETTFDKYYRRVVNKSLWVCGRQSTFSSLCLFMKAWIRVVEGVEQQEERDEWKGYFRPRVTDLAPGRTEETWRTTPIIWTWKFRSTLTNTNTNSNNNNNNNRKHLGEEKQCVFIQMGSGPNICDHT